MIVSRGTQGKILKKESKVTKKIFHIKTFSQKTNPKIVSIIVHRKDIKKQKSKLKNFFLGNELHKKLSQRSYQCGTQGSQLKKTFH